MIKINCIHNKTELCIILKIDRNKSIGHRQILKYFKHVLETRPNCTMHEARHPNIEKTPTAKHRRGTEEVFERITTTVECRRIESNRIWNWTRSVKVWSAVVRQGFRAFDSRSKGLASSLRGAFTTFHPERDEAGELLWKFLIWYAAVETSARRRAFLRLKTPFFCRRRDAFVPSGFFVVDAERIRAVNGVIYIYIYFFQVFCLAFDWGECVHGCVGAWLMGLFIAGRNCTVNFEILSVIFDPNDPSRRMGFVAL